MKKYLIIVAVLILAIGVYLLINNIKPGSEPLPNTFTHSTGGYSFKYPAGITVVEKKEENTVLIYSTNEPTKPIAAISVLYFPKYVSSRISEASKNSDYVIKYGTLDKYKTYDITSKTTGPSVLIVSLESSDDPSYFMIINRLSKTVKFSDEEFDLIIKSISIDENLLGKLKEYSAVVTNKAVDDANQKAAEAKLKGTLAYIRPEAELYYDLLKSYSGMCKPNGGGQIEKQLNDAFKILADGVGANNLNCIAKQGAYAVSIKLPKSDIWCVDSTGFIGSIITITPNKYSCR